MNDNVTNDDLMKCPTCGAERVSRYAAYCHVCGSPLPELPPAPEDEAAWTGNRAARPDPGGRRKPRRRMTAAGAQPSAQGQPPSNPQGQPYPGGPGGQPPPPPSGGVRVYDRPDVAAVAAAPQATDRSSWLSSACCCRCSCSGLARCAPRFPLAATPPGPRPAR